MVPRRDLRESSQARPCVTRKTGHTQLAVLMYHGVVSKPLAVPDWCFLSESEFRKQMEFLARNTRVVSLAQGARELAQDDGSCSVALTFDDGLQCVYDVAFPILRNMGIPATLFLATDFVGTDRRLWFCDVNRALAATPLQALTWKGATYDLAGLTARAHANARLQAELKKHSQPILLEHLADLIARLRPSHEPFDSVDRAFNIVGEPEVAEMVGSGLIDLGAHTGSHAILSLLNEQEVSDEISRSVARTSQLAGVDCRLFAYPNGRRMDYTDYAKDELRALGIEVAVTTNDGPNRTGQSLLELNRVGVGADMEFERFKSLLEPFTQADSRTRRMA